ncbi:MAG TPA: Maf family protein [Bryobacteraceae bacterium]|jgi:septum formation protein|nr:Maf family protein [Bryobacteraceae bacterium]
MIVLASASPRRAEILTLAGIRFERQAPAGIDETPKSGEKARDYVMRLAREKARAIGSAPGRVVLGADTTVVMDGQILGKPEDAGDAARMLRLLSGRAHEVITGVCLRSPLGEAVDAATTEVWFTRLTDAEIEAYVASGEPMDKAGAYGIQGLASKFVTRIEGCYFNVMGLPVALVYARIRDNPAFMI